MEDYPIIFEPSFIVMWGVTLAIGFSVGGFLALASAAFMLLVLVHHEHAHIKEMERRHVRINYVMFTWLGGMVHADIQYANDAVPILLAGLRNTGIYAFFAYVLYFGVTVISQAHLTGINFANNPYLLTLNNAMLFTFVLFISNIIPGTIRHKKYGAIRTDGWAAYIYKELQYELWNDGKSIAMNSVVAA
jgi:hypothetical protein